MRKGMKRFGALALAVALMATPMDLSVLAAEDHGYDVVAQQETDGAERRKHHVAEREQKENILPIAAVDEEMPAVVGNTGVDAAFTEVGDEAALLAAISNGENVRLTAEIVLTDCVTIEQSIIVDLNGKNVYGASDKNVFTISGSDTEVIFTELNFGVYGQVHVQGSDSESVVLLIENGASVTIESGFFFAGECEYAIHNKGTLNVTGGNVCVSEEDQYGIRTENGSTTIISGNFFHVHYSGNPRTLVGYNGGLLDLSGVTRNGHECLFHVLPESGQLLIPEGYGWFLGTDMVEEIPVSTKLTLDKPVHVLMNPNGGTGEELSLSVMSGYFYLPECQFGAPDGMRFLGWSVEPDGELIAYNEYELTEDEITFYAIWIKVTDVYVGDVPMEHGDYLATGADQVSESKPATGGYAYYDGENGVLILDNYEYTGWGSIFDPDYPYYSLIIGDTEELEIELKGENHLTSTYDYGTGIYVPEGNLTITGEGTLTMQAEYGMEVYGTYDEENNYVDGGHVTIESGTLNLDAYCPDSAYGISADGNIIILEAALNFDAYSEWYEAVGMRSYNASVDVRGGSLNLNVESVEDYGYGIRAEKDVICNGTITIEAYSEYCSSWGIEADDILVEGGYIDITTGGANGTAVDGLWELDEETMEILLPEGGRGILSEGYICNAVGDDVSSALILPVTEHQWSEQYAYDAITHWYPCEEEDCFLRRKPEYYGAYVGSGYGEHDTNGEGGVCSVCGYDSVREVDLFVGGVGMVSGEYLDKNNRLSTTKPANGGYAYYADGVLTLDNYQYTGRGYSFEWCDEGEDEPYTVNALLVTAQKTTLELVGENTLINTADYGDGIFVEDGEFTITGTGSVSIEATNDAIDVNYGSLTISGGELTLFAGDDGVDSVGVKITMDDGILNIDAGDDGIYSEGGLLINGGILNIDDGDDGIDSEEAVTFAGGTTTIDSDDKGIDIEADITIQDGTLNIASDTDDCINAVNATVYGGTFNLEADDDGFRITEKLVINHGNITINAGDYGLYSEQDITINGADIVITSDLDDEPEGAPAIVAVNEITLGDYVVIRKPEEGSVAVVTDEYEETYKAIVDSNGEAVTYVELEAVNPFADVAEGGWQYPFVKFAFDKGLMGGNGNDESGKVIFRPNDSITREQFVQILHSKENKPDAAYSDRFSDVIDDKWYTTAIMWATENGVVAGKDGGTRFGLTEPITREEMATMLRAYATFKGWNTEERASFDSFSDAADVSSWATQNMQWAIAEGIMAGKGERIAPRENATRAEAATMLKALIAAYE